MNQNFSQNFAKKHEFKIKNHFIHILYKNSCLFTYFGSA